MTWLKGPFDPIDDHTRILFGIMALAAGLAGVALMIYAAFWGVLPTKFIAAIVAGATGVFSLIIARRLLTNRTPHPSGALISPWLLLVLGVIVILVAVGNMFFGRLETTWMIAPGAAAAFFAWRQLDRESDDPPSRPSDGA
jgi:hypothetical protein